MFTNREILSSVLLHWMKPMFESGIVGKMMGGFLTPSGKFSVGNTLINAFAPMLSDSASALVDGALNRALSMLPDENIPEFARDFVQSGIKRGGIDLFGIEIEKEDLEELAQLLELNLPVISEKRYQVKEGKKDV